MGEIVKRSWLIFKDLFVEWVGDTSEVQDESTENVTYTKKISELTHVVWFF